MQTVALLALQARIFDLGNILTQTPRGRGIHPTPSTIPFSKTTQILMRLPWVDQEIDWALMKEEELKRPFLVPIALDGTLPSLKIRGRIQADLSRSYSDGLNRLISFLDSKGLKGLKTPINRVSLPLIFRDYIHLDYRALEASFSHTIAPWNSIVRSNQLFVNLEHEYMELRRTIMTRLDNIESDSYYSPTFASNYNARIRWLRDMEAALVKGVAFIINRFYLDKESNFTQAFEACHSFALCWRAELIRHLYESQNPDDPPLTLGETLAADRRGFSGANAHLFCGNKNLPPHDRCALDVFTSDYSWSACIYIFDRSGIREQFKECGNRPLRVADALSYDQIAWFLIPQLTARHLEGLETRTDWRNFKCGLS